MSEPNAAPLRKQGSWSPDTCRDEAWLRRKGHNSKRGRCKSVTDEDLDELKGCIELGFGFDSPQLGSSGLSETLPALDLYYAVNQGYNDSVTKSVSVSEPDGSSPRIGSSHALFGRPGDNPQLVKTRLKQWAQVVACSVRQSS